MLECLHESFWGLYNLYNVVLENQCAKFALGPWERVYDQPKYLQQNMYSQSIIFMSVAVMFLSSVR